MKIEDFKAGDTIIYAKGEPELFTFLRGGYFAVTVLTKKGKELGILGIKDGDLVPATNLSKILYLGATERHLGENNGEKEN